MRHFAAVDASDHVVSAMSVDDASPDPYTPEMMAQFDPPGVRSLETPVRARPRKDKLDGSGNVVPDPDTVDDDRIAADETFFDEAKLKAAFLAMMDTVNVRLTTAGQTNITGAELLAAYKLRRGH